MVPRRFVSDDHLLLGDELDHLGGEFGFILDGGYNLINVLTARHQVADLLNNALINHVVLIDILAMTPDIALNEIYTLHIEDGSGRLRELLMVRGWQLDHSQPGASLHQLHKIDARGSECDMDH